jgi:hypothetical protein
MENPNYESRIPAALLQKLDEVRRHDRRVRVLTGLLRGLSVLLGAMLVAITIDWLASLHNQGWRWTLTLIALSCGGVALVYGCLLPLLRSRSLTSLAREVDEAHPNLEERYLTLTEFARSNDAPELRGSESMIQKVEQQATSMSGDISAESIVPRAGLARAAKYFGYVCAVLVILFLVNFSQMSLLCGRFWAPGADISLTQIESKTGDITVGKGDNVTLELVEKGKLTDSASLFLRSTSGRNEVVRLDRGTSTNAQFVYTQNAVVDSFEYRARSGDGQTAWHRVTVTERPKISQVKLRVVPPAYSHLQTVEEKSLPRRLRALEGSQLEVAFQSDQPLASMTLKFSDGKTQVLTASSDGYHFNATLSNSIGFQAVLTNLQRLDNLSKPACDIEVYPDQPPSVAVISPNSEITARPDDKVKVEFEARDDFGLSSAELVVNVKGETNTETKTFPIPLGKDAGARFVRKQVDLDLAQFKLKQDQELSYFVRVTDTKQNPGLSSPGQPPSSEKEDQKQLANNETQPQQKESSDNSNTNLSSRTNNSPPATQNPQLANKSQLSAASPPKPASGNDSVPSKNSPESTPQVQKSQPQLAKNSAEQPPADPAHQDNKIHLAANNSPPKPSDEQAGSQPPPNNMTKRVLDVGQCSSCQPMKILVDEWGRSFEGQMREKLELAIDPTLKLLDELLGKAQQATDSTLAAGQREGLSHKQDAPVQDAKANLRQADVAVTELKKVSQGTPYAFIGLQIHDIRETHISPARINLGDVVLEPATAAGDVTNLQSASFQIKSARQKLADLTKTYESVKRDNKLADAMQRLTKMHQIFLEDTQAMLGSKKPNLNPMDRKVAEVSDEYAEKLRKLLEEKKKIMAELSKILADDPRLLRRFLALEELDGTTLRDQMTLLARRQQSLATEATQWTALGDNDRAAWLKQEIHSQAAEQQDVALLAAKTQENMVTWLPLEVPPDTEPVVACRKIAEDAARLAGEAAEQTSAENLDSGVETAKKALAQFRLLQGSLPRLEWVEESGKKISIFEANRMDEAATLITRQSGWIKKIEALRAGDYPQAAEVDQHRLMQDTTELSEKLDSTAVSLSGLSAEINTKAKELNGTVHHEVLPEQSSATQCYSRKTVKEASAHQCQATNAFAKGEKQFDELLHLIIAKLDAAPPPTDPGMNKSLEQLLAELQDEKKAAEKLGIPCRPINVAIEKDWLKPGSSSGGQQARAQTRAAQEQARKAVEKTQQTRDQAKKLAAQRITDLKAVAPNTPVSGPKHATASWNTIVSKLGDEIRQGRDNVPPEQYRQAIEQYFDTISQNLPATPPPASQENR